MDKRALLAAIVAQLTAETERLARAALATHAEATDPENKAEHKYDTRGLEASYLAQGQSHAAEEAALALTEFQALALRDMPLGGPVALGALVTVADASGGISRYFVGPRAGGTEVEHAGGTVLVLTPASPLGRRLLGLRTGDPLPTDRAALCLQSRIVNVE